MAQTLAAPRDRGRALSRVGAIAAALTAGALLLSLVGFLFSLPGLALRDWLVVLFQTDTGIGTLPAEPLRAFNPMDLVILALAGFTFLGYWPALKTVNRVGAALAIALPFAGIAVLLASGEAGRSGLMGGGLVFSALLLRPRSSRRLAVLGLGANALLLAGDFGSTGSRAPGVAAMIAVGYVLLVAWFALLATRATRVCP